MVLQLSRVRSLAMEEQKTKPDRPVSAQRRFWVAVLAFLFCGTALFWLSRPARVGLAFAETLAPDERRVEGARHPPPGSPERRAILDALRGLVPEKDGKKALFVVRHLRLSGDWAWVETDPQSADGRDHYEPVECLLRNQAGSWTVQECRPCCGECEDDPDCREKSRYYRSLRTRFPEAPREIFPEP